MEPYQQWVPSPPPVQVRPPGRPWLPAAIFGAAIVIAAGLVAGALIVRKGDSGPTTCQSWTETRRLLESVPALPSGWNWGTPDIDIMIRNQNSPVETVLDIFEPKIVATPADVAQAARDYLAARRHQMQTLTDRSYTPQDGAAVDDALNRLNDLCGIASGGRPI